MTDISAGSITPAGYLVLQTDTSYNLFGNLVLDGTSFKGISGGNMGTSLNGQGYTLTISDSSYNESTAFPTPIAVSNLTLINPVSSGSWGSASPAATCYAFTGPLTGPTVVSVANIDPDDFFIYLSAGEQYTLSGNLAVSAGVFNGFKVVGTGNVILDGAGHTVTMTADGGLMSNDNQGASLLVKGLTVDASGVDISNGNGWIFGTGFTNMIAVDCHVTCGELDVNSGGIFGGVNTGFVCATGCSVVCGNIRNTGEGGGGGICGGANNATISITDCSAAITGNVSNDGGGGGGGGLCGGFNSTASITITNCSADIIGNVTNDATGGGGGMCGGDNGFGGNIKIYITNCAVDITGNLTNAVSGGAGGMCGGINGYNGQATISITGCSATIEGSVTNAASGGSGGMCGGFNAYAGSATISITDCSATIGVTMTNDGAGGMCGGANGAGGGNANIFITRCMASISGIVAFGSILGADMVFVTLLPHAPYTLSLNGFTLGWVGGNDVYYNIYVAGTLHDLSGITGLSANIASQLQYGTTFQVSSVYTSSESALSNTITYGSQSIPTNLSFSGTILSWDFSGDARYNIYVGGVLHNLSGITTRFKDISSNLQYGIQFAVSAVQDGIESEQSSTILYLPPPTPTNLSLSGTILSWKGPPDVNYNIYVAGVLYDLTGITGLSTDIASQLQYGIHFQVSAIYTGSESTRSAAIVYLPPSAPTNLFLDGTILSWTGPSDVSYSVCYETQTSAGYTIITTQSALSYDIQGYTGLNLTYFVQAIYGSSTSANSSTVSDTSTFSGSAVNPTIYIQAALDASSDITTLKDTLINHPSSFTPSIAYLTGVDMTKFVSEFTTTITSVSVSFLLPTAGIPASLLPSSGYLYLLGDVNTTVDYTIDGSAQTVFFDVSSIAVNGVSTSLGGNFLFYGRSYTFVGVGSALGSPYSPPANPSRKPKPLSSKALRIANAFSSYAFRNRVVSGREMIRTLQTGSKRNFQSSDAMIDIDAARIYIRGKE